MSHPLESAYARILVDNHISEDDPSFMRAFDPARFVATLQSAGADAAMVYACCHNGNCYYPTRVGHVHRNLEGRDLFGETIQLLRQAGIAPIAYYTVVYDRRTAQSHPAWRVTQVDGQQHYRRSWHNCPNNAEYADYARRQIAEIVAYDVDGLFIDMTVWPGVCFCHACRSRYRREAGAEIPETLDWSDPRWVGFQRARERWLVEFAESLTAAAKAVRPGLQVVHQCAPALYGWYYGQSPALRRASDYGSGDFYGGRNQQRLGTKALAALSQRMPYEFMTSRTVTLFDHTSTKSEAELTCSAATTLANAGAYFFIDAINPDGTLEASAYARLAAVSRRLRPFKEAIAAARPTLVADCGLYFSSASHVRPEHNGSSLRKIMDPASHMLSFTDIRALNEVIGASTALGRAGIPYRVLTEQTTDYAGLAAIVVNDAAFLSTEEVARLRAFVAAGGTLIATGMTSYYDLAGATSGDFALADVLGVSYAGAHTARVHYLLTDAGPLLCDHPAPRVRATTARVLAGVAEPQFDPDDLDHFAAFHSNPPGPAGPYAGLTEHAYGAGRAIYLYASLLAQPHDAQQSFGATLLRRYAPSGLLLESNAPAAVEITLLQSATEDCYLLCFVNYQGDLPNIPARDLRVTLRLPGGRIPRTGRRISDGQPAALRRVDGAAEVALAALDTMEVIELR